MTKLTEAEWAVLQVLWEKGPCPLGEIVSALEGTRRWRRNTVHTYLTRMEAKGLVIIDKSREPHFYDAAVQRDDCTREARTAFLETVYGGAAGDLIAAFLKESQITPEERDRLRDLLDHMEV